jgi:outer membrane protein insertion porin family
VALLPSPQTPTMANAAAADSTVEQAPNPAPHDPAGKSGADSRRRDGGEVNADGDGDEYEDEEELDGPAAENEKINAVFQRLSSAPVATRVHEIIIKGNSKTRDALIEAEVTDLIRSAATVQDLVRAASLATGRLRDLDVFDSVHITLDAGPPELPGTTTVVVQVVETANPISGSVGCLTKAEVSLRSFHGSSLH